MSDLERAYIDVKGQTFKKVKAKDGRTMHFKDGTPISENGFNGGLANKKFDGQKVNVAVPHSGGPGFKRKEVNPIEASALGQELRLNRDDVPGQPRQTITLGGEKYDLDELARLNQNIVSKYGPDSVMKY